MRNALNGTGTLAGRGGGSPLRTTFLVITGLAAAGTLLLLGRQAAHLFPAVVSRVEALGSWGPVAFVLIYAVAVVTLVPASVLTLAAGALFGIVRGTAFTLLGAVLGSAAAFLIARHLARAPVERRLLGDPRFAAIDRAIGDRGFLVVFLLRLSPIFPFSLLNYALGLTRVRFKDYLLAFAGTVPGTLLYTYSGRVAGEVAVAAGGGASGGGWGRWILLLAGLLATVGATAIVTRAARRALAERTTGDPHGASEGAGGGVTR